MRRYLFASVLLLGILVATSFGAWIVKINTSSTTVHAGPGVAYAVIDQLKYGDSALLLEEKWGWYLVLLENGKKGWILSTKGIRVKISDEEARERFGLAAESAEEVEEAQFFRKIGGDVVPYEIERLLKIALSEEVWEQRKIAIERLAEIDSPDAAGALMEIFDRGDAQAARAAVVALTKREDDATLLFMADRIKKVSAGYEERKALVKALVEAGDKGKKLLAAILPEVEDRAMKSYIKTVLASQ